MVGPFQPSNISFGFITRLQGYCFSAHNPYEDNGLKFFDEFGNKLNDISENRIEENYQNINYETPSNFFFLPKNRGWCRQIY